MGEGEREMVDWVTKGLAKFEVGERRREMIDWRIEIVAECEVN
jgi:hypothetical protein